VEQSGPDRLAGMFPCPVEDIPEYISVVLLDEAGDDARLRLLASQARALRVRAVSLNQLALSHRVAWV
jgi:hypothetical protein